MTAETTGNNSGAGVQPSMFTTAQNALIELATAIVRQMIAAGSVEVRSGTRSRASIWLSRQDGNVIAYGLCQEWTRVGRSLAADIRFDDPTVSRRHALIVRSPTGCGCSTIGA